MQLPLQPEVWHGYSGKTARNIEKTLYFSLMTLDFMVVAFLDRGWTEQESRPTMHYTCLQIA